MSRFEAQDQLNNPAPETTDFEQIVSRGLNRRQFIGGAAIAGLSAMTMGCADLATSLKSSQGTANLIGFKPVPASGLDTIVVPEGYRWDVLVSWGDPLFSNVDSFKDGGLGSAEAQALQFGDNNDGMSFYPLSEDRAIMAINNEYTNYEYLFPHQGKAMTASDVRKAQAAHGVSIIEVERKDGRWHLVKDSPYNRRIHANTPMQLTGPAAGHPLMQTSADPKGVMALGTFNNCANGQTPWGTYLTCEENFNGYFGSSEETLTLSPETKRYGIKTKDAGYQWHQFDERFDLAKNPQEPHRFGWVVEIDPKNPNSTPKKRTALGRFKHENAALTINSDGHVVVYLGDDERGEHLYKFVSKHRYQPENPSANLDLLEEGTLYVARFSSEIGKVSGRGEWLELSYGKNGLTAENGFNSQAEVLIFARKAATLVGATTMDRPEWVAVHPSGKQVFCTLTNNKNRGKEGQPVGGPNPRAKNNYGQIVRWQPDQQDHTQLGFSWDLFVMAGNPEVHPGTAYAGSANITADNMFNSPDGLGFDAAGRLWIQTDGKYSNKGDFAGMGNNQMLCADPTSGEIRRFLTGPIACEITGLAFSPDYKTLFIGIQHPGEELEPSHFPLGGDHTPRSSVIAIQKIDGGIIGS